MLGAFTFFFALVAQSDPVADVVHFIQDMLFTSKLREVAKQMGVAVQAAREPAARALAQRRRRWISGPFCDT